MTADDFQKRQLIIKKAMLLYGEVTGGNITEALQMLNDPDFEIFVPASEFKGLTGSPFDFLERPTCPDCDTDMYIRSVPKNDDGVKTQLVCQNENCSVVLDSELTMDEWMDTLEPKRIS